MRFYVFLDDSVYDQGQGSLEEHLQYLKLWGGSAQGEAFDHLVDAAEMAKHWADMGETQVITDDNFNVLDTVRAK